MDELLYWIWLSTSFSYGSNKPNELMTLCDTPRELFNMSEKELEKLEIIDKNDIKRMKLNSLKRAQYIVDMCNDKGISVVTLADELYPNRLKMIYGPPVVLYYKGNISGINDLLCIGVVGTRNVSEYYKFTTEYISYQVAMANSVIISGCAVGCDTAAHSGALLAHKRTIAVLACGIDVDYPKESRKLKQDILASGGALISEMIPGEDTNSKIFHARNRLIAGLSNGVLITQAPVTSGALITAEHAIEQGKEIFCLSPYSIFDSSCSGVIKYLRDGAIPVFSASDVISPYINEYAYSLDIDKIYNDYIEPSSRARNKASRSINGSPKIGNSIQGENADEKENNQKNTQENASNSKITVQQIRKNQENLLNSIDESLKVVYNKLELSPKYVDVLSVECGIPTYKLLAMLTELELAGLCESHSGNRYSLKK